MQTILIVLDPGKLKNPDLDLRYRVPERLEKVSNSAIRDNGYDFIEVETEGEENASGPLLGIWLETESAEQNWATVRKVLESKKFCGNDLSASAKIYISTKETAALEDCTLVFPA